ncbi:MAG: glycosyltransferase family 2 protein [Methanomicrobiales archaeon]|nr:glycosyltransferase family 2 protein [Methanomicrobiales archaeon]
MMTDYVVLTWNSASTLELALSSIQEYGCPDRIIVVDKHSTDRTTAIAGEYGCEIMSSDASLGAARRIGAREARTDLNRICRFRCGAPSRVGRDPAGLRRRTIS